LKRASIRICGSDCDKAHRTAILSQHFEVSNFLIYDADGLAIAIAPTDKQNGG
jgi:hypothetical protein